MIQVAQNGTEWSGAALKGLAYSASIDYGIPAGGLEALLVRESSWNINAISGAGAEGIAQFMPATSEEWGVDPWNPESAIGGAARYLAWLRFELPTWQAALAAYNWGIGNVNRNLGEDGYVPLGCLPMETKNYVQSLAPAFGDRAEGGTGNPCADSWSPLVVLLAGLLAYRALS